MVNRENADRALKDTEEFMNFSRKLHRKGVGDHTLFKGKALKFPLAWPLAGRSNIE